MKYENEISQEQLTIEIGLLLNDFFNVETIFNGGAYILKFEKDMKFKLSVEKL